MKGKHLMGLRLCLTWLLVLSLMASTRVGLTAPPLTTLYGFSGSDGAGPLGSLIQGKDGNLYGTTSGGNAVGNYGTVFQLTPSGALTTLCFFNRADGSLPFAGLLQGMDGALYGTTEFGGAYGNYGTVFQITTSGALTTLYSFRDIGGDGELPVGGLLQGKNGNLYGTTSYGGVNGAGTVYQITPSSVLTTLYSFTDTDDGRSPYAGLIRGKDGNLYGTTLYGGVNDAGTVYQITPSGVLTTLYTFTKGDDGASPYAGLLQDSDGNFYGTTAKGGANHWGTVFKLTPSGALTTLHSFTDGKDGGSPEAGLIQGRDHNLYGTTARGGRYGDGAVFQITISGVLTTLHSFNDGDGATPLAGLLQGKDGNLYGTTYRRGPNGNYGTVFKLTMTPVITRFSPADGPIGTTVTLTGANFTEVTSVKFGAVSAAFTIQSDTSLTFVVPAGANSAKITVINPFGKGVSSTAFKVTP